MKFTSGIITGAIIGAVGVAGYVLSDNRTRRKVARSGKRLANKAESLIGNISDWA